ncbi:MAG TPA: glycosyltransferase family 1 protein, partial [Planctomycetota bacterium]|nr:glycosyltransferase family 1 protein [Planctomycetota bacterium]
MKVVVAGLMARFPLGGVAYDYIQYVLGFRRLGCDVFYLEDTGEYCYNPEQYTFTEDASWNAAYLARVAARFGLAEGQYCLRNWNGDCLGVSHDILIQKLRSADLFVNISGTCWLRDEYRDLPMRKVFIDSDPGYNHVWVALGSAPGADPKLAAAVERIRAHDVHYTFAENQRGADCALPATPGIAWRPTRQPVVLDLFEPAPPEAARPELTTVMRWKAHEYELEIGGRKYGGKARSMEPYHGVPARFGRRS